MTRLLVVASALLLAGTVHAQQSALLGDIDFSGDTDGFHASRERIGAFRPYGSYFDHFGVALQTTRYSQSGWSRDVPGIVGLYRRQDAATLAGIDATGGVVQVAGHTRVVGDATWSLRPATDTGVELIAAGDVVATQKAIERAIAYGFFAASAEHTFPGRLTAIGLVGYQPFTDGNDRVHFRARLVWQAIPDYGVNLQLRWRQYESHKDDVGGAYFNPGRYHQWQAVAGMRRHVGTWTVSAALGAGRETIDGSDTHPVRSAELRGEGAVGRGLHLAFYAVYNRSTSYVDSPDYAYRQVGVTLIHPF